VPLEPFRLSVVRAGDPLDCGEREHIFRVRRKYEHVMPRRLTGSNGLESIRGHAASPKILRR